MFQTIRTRKAEAEAAEAVNRDRTLFEQAWIQFKYNKRAMFGLVVIGLLLFIVLCTVVIDLVTQNGIYDNYVVKQKVQFTRDYTG